MYLRMIADQEVIPVLRTARGLDQITELAVQHPQARPTHTATRLVEHLGYQPTLVSFAVGVRRHGDRKSLDRQVGDQQLAPVHLAGHPASGDRKSTRLNSSHVKISYAVFC